MRWAWLLLTLSGTFFQEQLWGMSLQRRPQGPPPYMRFIQDRVDEGFLSQAEFRNGLRVVVEEQAGSPIVQLDTYVLFPPGEAAAALRLAAGLVRSKELCSRFTEIGAVLEVRQTQRWTRFATLVPAENLGKAVEIHADLLRSAPTLAALEAGWEGVVWEDGLQDRGLLRELLQELGEKVAPPPSGEPSRLLELYRLRYRPGNTWLVAVGNVLRERLYESIPRLYGNLRGGRPALPGSGQESTPAGFSYEVQRGAWSFPYVLLSYPIPHRYHPDYEPLLLLTYALAEGRSSPLRRLPGHLLWGDAFLHSSGAGGALRVLFVPDPEHLDGAEFDVLALLEMLVEQGVTPAELTRAKARLLVDFYRDLKQPAGRSEHLMRGLLEGSLLNRDRFPARIMGISADRLRQVARRYLLPERLSVKEFLPLQFEERTFTAEAFLETYRLLREAARRRLEQERTQLTLREEEAQFRPPDFQPRPAPTTFRRTSILRGPEIYYREEHQTPLAVLGMVWPGGRLQEEEDNQGITALMLRVLLRGLEEGERPFSWIAWEARGLQLEILTEPDYFGYLIRIYARDLQRFLEEFLPALKRFSLSSQSLEEERQKLRVEGALRRDLLWQRQVEELRRLLFSPHPYAWSAWGNSRSLADIRFQDLQDWLRQQMLQKHPLLLLEGDFQGTAFLEGLVSVLADSSQELPQPVSRPLQDFPRRRFLQVGGEGLLGLALPPWNSRAGRVLRLLGPWLRAAGPCQPGRLEVNYAYGAGWILFVSGEAGEKALLEALERGFQLPRARFLSRVVGGITLLHQMDGTLETVLPRLVFSIFSNESPEVTEREISGLKGFNREQLLESLQPYLVEPTSQREQAPLSP